MGTTIQDGTDTIAMNTDISNPITGTFDTILFNGVTIDPSQFTVNYGIDSITRDITAVIPEAGTYALLAGCFAMISIMLRRR